jgi:type IV pilus assembly protein PilB
MNTPSPMPLRLGDILLKYRLITPEQLEEALQQQKVQKKRLGSLLINKGLLTEEDMNFVLSQQLDVPYVHLTLEMIDQQLIKTIPREIMERYEVLPLITEGKTLTLAMSDPTDIDAINEVAQFVNLEIKPALVKSSSIRHVIENIFNQEKPGAEPGITEARFDTLKDLIKSAINEKADEIHMEASARHISVRFRINGELVNKNVMSISVYQALLNSFKSQVIIEAGSAYMPYSKAYAWDIDGKVYYLEAHTLPTMNGESLTLHIHQGGRAMEDNESFPELPEPIQKQVEAWVNDKDAGIFLITGKNPVINKKIAYGILTQGNSITHKICTLERYPSILNNQYTQTFLDFRPGLTEEMIMNQFLRIGADILYLDLSYQYPHWDIIFNAALQKKKILVQAGYKDVMEVLNIIKNNPPLAEPMNSHLHTILASAEFQTLCPSCKVPAKSEGAFIPTGIKKRFLRGKGCDKCQQSGIINKVVYYEIFANHVFPASWWRQKNSDKLFEEVSSLMKQPSIWKQIESPLSEGLLSIEEANKNLSNY